jgi:hypothetical protein
MKRKSDELLRQVSVMIAELNEIIEKVRMGKMKEAFGVDQAHAFIKAINAGIKKLTEELKRGKISRGDALLVAAQGSEAIAAIKKMGFGAE